MHARRRPGQSDPAQDGIGNADRRQQVALRIGLGQTSERELLRIERTGAGYEQQRHAMGMGMAGHIHAALVAMKGHVGDHQVDSAQVDRRDRMIIIVDRPGHHITGMGQEMLVVESHQRLILDDQYRPDGLLASHCAPSCPFPPEKHLPFRPVYVMHPDQRRAPAGGCPPPAYVPSHERRDRTVRHFHACPLYGDDTPPRKGTRTLEPPKKSGPPKRPGPAKAAGSGAGKGPGGPKRPSFGQKPRGPAGPNWSSRRPAKPKGPAQPANPHPARIAAADAGETGPQRIAKLLARAGIASRREVERMIEEGRVALNGEALTTPATLLPSLQGVTVDGAAVGAPAPARLFLFHKQSGFLTAERDPRGRPTIYDKLPPELPRVMPIGRLDMTTEGLLLLTTDGEFKRQMELPATGVPRTYRARAFGEISQAQLEDLFDGIEIEGIQYGRIEANLERRTGRNQWIEMTLTEGKNREVRRVLEHLGLQVNRLIRTSYGPFALADMPPGAVEEVPVQDLNIFRKTLKTERKDK